MNSNLLYTDTEESLRESVRSLLEARLDHGAVAALYDGPGDFRELWRALAGDLGLAALLVPENLGGVGASAREAAVVLEELGRAVAPLPFLSSAVIATTALTALGDERLPGRLAEGECVAVLAMPLSCATDAWPAALGANRTISGDIRSVADAAWADWLLVPATSTNGEPVLAAVEAPSASIASIPSLDMSRQLADVRFDGASCRVLATGDGARAAVAEALQVGAGLLASEQFGVASWCLDETLGYAKTRYQFGRAIGSYQAFKHRLADLFLEVESLGAIARYAADTLAQRDDDIPIAVSVAQAFGSDTTVHVAEEAIQLHGGIGMTWEHPAHLYLKRAKANQVALGSADLHRRRLAELVDLPA